MLTIISIIKSLPSLAFQLHTERWQYLKHEVVIKFEEGKESVAINTQCIGRLTERAATIHARKLRLDSGSTIS